jgi:hypothetical protein
MGKYEKALSTFSDQSGTFFDQRRPGYGREKISFTFNDIMTFEDHPWWSELFIKGGVTASADAGTPIAYTRVHAPSPSTDDLKSLTLEFNEVGNPYESHQVMAKTATMRMDSDNDSEPTWMMDMECLGLGWTPTTYTAALADRTTEVIYARGTKLYIDTTTIGSTQVLGKLINASISIDTGIHFKAFSEDVTGYAANKVGRGPYKLTAQFTFEFDDDVEFANYRSSLPVPRKIRMVSEGSQIHGSSVVNKKFQLDFPDLIWSSFSRGDREGNLTAVFGATGFYDVTAAKLFEQTVVNALVTLP